MSEITLSVPEIHCNHCKMSIEGALRGLPGVRRAEVDVPAATVALSFDAPATYDRIVAAIEEQGYSVPARG